MAKTLSFGVLHVGIAFGVSYALSGSVAVAGAVTLVEPLCNMVAHYFFDGWWSRREAARAQAVAAEVRAAGGPRGEVVASAPGGGPRMQELVAQDWAFRARLAA